MITAGDTVTIHPPPYAENECDLKQVPLEKAVTLRDVVDAATFSAMYGSTNIDFGSTPSQAGWSFMKKRG